MMMTDNLSDLLLVRLHKWFIYIIFIIQCVPHQLLVQIPTTFS